VFFESRIRCTANGNGRHGCRLSGTRPVRHHMETLAMNVVGIQLGIFWEYKQAYYERNRTLFENQSIHPGDMVVLPKILSTGFSMDFKNIS
jgi:hypothetical protein